MPCGNTIAFYIIFVTIQPGLPIYVAIFVTFRADSYIKFNALKGFSGQVMAYPMGESKFPPLRVDFDRRLKLEFHGSKITSDAGLLAYRELDEVLGLTDLGGAALSDLRRGKNTRHLLTGLFRQSVFGRLAGYEDVNDADRLSRDQAMRAIVDRQGLDRGAASTSQMGCFKTEWLAMEENLAALTDISGIWIDWVLIARCRRSSSSASIAPRARPMAGGPGGCPTEALNRPWFAPGEPPVLLGVGRLTEQENFPTLIRAFAKVRQQRPVRLVILGEGEERSALERLCDNLGVQDDVELPGFFMNPLCSYELCQGLRTVVALGRQPECAGGSDGLW
jgi:glycosyltransferase involved in cell wall biosynthesis